MKFSTLEWIHPSWRDLVIDNLTGDESMRSKFLSVCSINGILLALSIGGGKGGDRTLPLLVAEDDWHILRERVASIVQTCTLDEHFALLSALANLIDRPMATDSDGGIAPRDIKRLRSFCLAVLSDCRNRWDSDAQPIRPHILDLYYSLSISFSPLPPSPDLDSTWRHYQDLLSNALNNYRVGGSIQEKAFTGFFSLVRLLFENEPRMLRRVGYPECFTELLSTFVSDAKAELSRPLVPTDPVSEHEMNEETSRLEDLKKSLEAVDSTDENLLKNSEGLAEEIASRINDLEELTVQMFPYDPDPIPFSDKPKSDRFSVEELFSDL